MSRALFIYIFFLNYTYCFAQQVQIDNTSKSGNVTYLLPERIMVHSDKQFYLSGEIMWFKIYVIQRDSYRLESLSSTAYTELIDQDGKPLLQAKIALNKGTGSGSFAIPSNAKSGSYHLRIYTNWMKNTPSSIFNENITVINTQQIFDTSSFQLAASDTGIEAGNNNYTSNQPGISENKIPVSYDLMVNTDQKIYKRRSPVELSISKKLADSALNVNLSVAIYQLNDINKPGGFVNNNQVSENNIKEMGHNTNPYSFIPEMEGYIVRIKVKNSQSGKIAEGVPVLLSLAGKLTDVQYGESDEKGIAYFDLQNVYGPQQLFIKTTTAFENVVDLELLKPFLAISENAVQRPIKIRNDLLVTVEEMHNNLVINQAFITDSIGKYYPTNPDSLSFYGIPSSTYLLDNYKRFTTMEEVLREYVTEVNVRIRKNKYYILILNKQKFRLRKYVNLIDNMMDENSPLVLLDGIPVTDLNKLMKYDPLKVRKIEAVAERYLIGKEIYDGILSFTTFKGEFDDLQLNNKEILVDDEGWQRQRKFPMPDYKNAVIKNNRIPDFRELLYWAPEVKTSKTNSDKISFYTGDLTGKFIAEIKGVTEDGRIVNQMITFEVEK
ncbi:MAG: hypothetical protein ABI204_03960 [Ginsengibacter sp.]